MPVTDPRVDTQVLMSQLCGVAFSRLAMTVVDRIFLPEPRLVSLRDEMVKIIEENKDAVRADRTENKERDRDRDWDQDRGYSRDQDAVIDYIRRSLEDLEKAKDTTRCKVCKREIDEAAAAVKSRLAVIQRSDALYRKLRELERSGELPPGATWSALSETEKDKLKRMITEEVAVE